MALASLAAGATAGAAVLGVGVFLFRVTAPPDTTGTPPHLLLQGAVLLSIALAATLAWHGARALTDGWRRGVTAALGAGGGLLLGALTVPADMVAGPIGLLAFALLMGVLARRAARAARAAEAP